jgi:hypothetical protein
VASYFLSPFPNSNIVYWLRRTYYQHPDSKVNTTSAIRKLNLAHLSLNLDSEAHVKKVCGIV